MLVILTDGDVVAHMACERAWGEKVEYFRLHGIDMDRFKGAASIPGYSPRDDVKTWGKCVNLFHSILKDLSEALFSDNMLMAMKDGKNFRDRIYHEYKRDRGKWRIPNPFVQMIRDYAVKEGLALHAGDKEADDLLRIWAEECRFYDIPFVVASIDKDLKCIPGKHYNLKKKVLEEVTDLSAMQLYYSQLLSGDPTDHIPGLPRIGPVKALKAIEHCDTPEQCQEVVCGMYFEVYHGEWEDYLLANGKLIHIQKSWNDYFTLKEWPFVMEMR
jgi:hypothetical protein